MASRAEEIARRAPRSADPGPPPTSLGGAVRAGLGDLYYHSWRLVPANVLWSLVAVGILVALVVSPYGIATIPLLAIPTVGLFRMTTRIARGEAASFWDGVDAWRREVRTTLATGAAFGFAALVLAVNLATGILSGTLLGWAFATLAFWGLIAAWLLAWTAGPLLADPWRAAWPARERLRLAGYLVLAHPVRVAALGLLLLVFLAASTVAIVAVITVSVAIAALVAARFILPAADRLDGRIGFAARRGLPVAEREHLE